MATLGTQHLLGRPQSVTPASSVHERELGEVDAGRSQRRRIRQMRRSKPHHALAGPRKRRQCGQDELELA